ncbi:putative transaldolase [Phaeomoniella chlamydospora]|uniref:Putative transaldolase n=1 Tax=Phaeomoniella chlamydospora TaxID=158046 RepID=A0A0G2GIT6_PHACM|nr:putative transaldolase [Phaeomoniella chlamydospora]
MGSAGPVTWLEKLDEQLNVDVDWMDPEYTKSMPIKPWDQTSNQLWVDIQMNHPDNQEMFSKTVKEYKDKGWLAIYTRVAVLMCKNNIDNIRGRVLLQVLPSNAYNGEKVIEHARITGPALAAAKTLEEEGIRTLGTALFGLPQAIACSQAGCLYISPYYNEVRAHDDLSLWPDVEDPASQHPMSARIVQILETYKRLYKETGKEQPLLKNASFISPKEAMAAGEMGCHSATISHTVLNELAKLQYDGTKQPGEGLPKPVHAYMNAGPTPLRLQKLSKVDPLAAANWDGKLASTEIDYLANNGAELEKAVEADPITKARRDDALKLFTGGEERSRAKIEEALKQL